MNIFNNKLLNFYLYHWKRSNWIFDPRFHFCDFKNIPIEKPIFLIGNQGGGLTLVSRILRRNPYVISVTGNHIYWSGADEMQNVFEPILPRELSGIKFTAPKHSVLTPPRSWSYATDELLPLYRNTEKDTNKECEEKLKKIIKYLISRYSLGEEPNYRFIDKSQVFTVKVSFINELLKSYKPKFILITRNPYASCHRAAIGRAGDMERYKKILSHKERLELCAQHWTNSMKCALEDKEKENVKMIIVRFEDILREPEKNLKKICEFSELDFRKDMLPQPEHKIPLGTRFKDRWYPLRPDVNKKYLDKLDGEIISVINKHCEKLVERFGYTPKGCI